MIAPLDERERRRHKRRNRIQSVLLISGMGGLLAICGWIIAGGEGVVWALLTGCLSLLFAPRVSPWLTLQMYGAVPLRPHDVPALYRVLDLISERAGLPRRPALYYVPSRMLNAFAVGRREEAAIAVTDGLLRRLTLRELAGVLAHEVSHVRNNDLWIMSLADVMNRVTAAMSLAGMILLFLSLPVLLLEGNMALWLLVGRRLVGDSLYLAIAGALTVIATIGAITAPHLVGLRMSDRPGLSVVPRLASLLVVFVALSWATSWSESTSAFAVPLSALLGAVSTTIVWVGIAFLRRRRTSTSGRVST